MEGAPSPEGSGGTPAGGTPVGGGSDETEIPQVGALRCSFAEMLKRASSESSPAVDSMGTSTAPGTEEGIFSARSSPTFGWDEDGALDDFALPPPAVPLEPPEDDDAELSECEGGLLQVDNGVGPAWWWGGAHLPTLRARTVHPDSLQQPPTPRLQATPTPTTPLLPTDAQLREGVAGVEGVLHRVRVDLEGADGVVAPIDHEERPTPCRSVQRLCHGQSGPRQPRDAHELSWRRQRLVCEMVCAAGVPN